MELILSWAQKRGQCRSIFQHNRTILTVFFLHFYEMNNNLLMWFQKQLYFDQNDKEYNLQIPIKTGIKYFHKTAWVMHMNIQEWQKQGLFFPRRKQNCHHKQQLFKYTMEHNGMYFQKYQRLHWDKQSSSGGLTSPSLATVFTDNQSSSNTHDTEDRKQETGNICVTLPQ